MKSLKRRKRVFLGGGERRLGNDLGEFEPSRKRSGGSFQVQTGGAQDRERAEPRGEAIWSEAIPEGSARTEGWEAKRPRHATGVPLARRGRFGRCLSGIAKQSPRGRRCRASKP